MSVGFIGAGAIAQALIRRMIAGGVKDIAVSNRRGPQSLSPLVAGFDGDVRAETVVGAARADMVVLAVPWSQVAAALAQVPDWSDKLLVDTTNPIEAPSFRAADLGEATSSEIVGRLASGARVVKAFNGLAPGVLGADPRVAGGRRALFYSGDDPAAKGTVAVLMRRMGFEGIDLGPLATGGALQQFPGGSLPTRDLVQL